ncbi:MAG: cbb3-type cytochrome c oxidase subunit II, partial [Magnetococcales bacterium]|nr:cbb3-type cytochrome c oxidase subunit II [Magnetococcales bacterium]
MKHEIIEKNIPLMGILLLLVVSIGGLVEIVPLFLIDSTIEKVEGMRPYTPLEL